MMADRTNKGETEQRTAIARDGDDIIITVYRGRLCVQRIRIQPDGTTIIPREHGKTIQIADNTVTVNPIQRDSQIEKHPADWYPLGWIDWSL